jgi:broad specificity phosphatase PhoE
MARLLVIRHAQSTWNRDGRWQGIADPGLSALGRRQADRAGRLLAADTAGEGSFAAVFSSDLVRARRTAELVGGHVAPGVPPRVEPGLREYDVGAWSGLTREQIDAGWPGALEAWRAGARPATPGGERKDRFDRRVRRAVEGLASSQYGDGAGRILVVTHGGVLRSIARWLGHPEHPMGHLSGYWLEHRSRAFSLLRSADLTRQASGEPAGR